MLTMHMYTLCTRGIKSNHRETALKITFVNGRKPSFLVQNKPLECSLYFTIRLALSLRPTGQRSLQIEDHPHKFTALLHSNVHYKVDWSNKTNTGNDILFSK